MAKANGISRTRFNAWQCDKSLGNIAGSTPAYPTISCKMQHYWKLGNSETARLAVATIEPIHSRTRGNAWETSTHGECSVTVPTTAAVMRGLTKGESFWKQWKANCDVFTEIVSRQRWQWDRIETSQCWLSKWLLYRNYKDWYKNEACASLSHGLSLNAATMYVWCVKWAKAPPADGRFPKPLTQREGK